MFVATVMTPALTGPTYSRTCISIESAERGLDAEVFWCPAAVMETASPRRREALKVTTIESAEAEQPEITGPVRERAVSLRLTCGCGESGHLQIDVRHVSVTNANAIALRVIKHDP